MKWRIPAKTFLLGEYAAVAGASAIILTTNPCFELTLTEDSRLEGIHPDSPAGQWWTHQRRLTHGLAWCDPYRGKGGLGASSAQFLATYLASCYLLNMTANSKAMLNAYYQAAWRGDGLRPSGYDLLAQSQSRCVYINRQQNIIKSYDWPFKDISFLLVHSGQKLATHYHLQRMSLPNAIDQLSAIAEQAHQAFEQIDSDSLLNAVNAYQELLMELKLVAPHSMKYLQAFKAQPDILAAKGCGALGADVLLLIIPTNCLQEKLQTLADEGWAILASNNDLYTGCPLMKNNPQKRLEILP